MPEYILDTSDSPQWESLDDFTKGFIEAAFFSETSNFDSSVFFEDEAQESIREGSADGTIPQNAGVAEIDDRSIEEIKEFCAEFQQRNADLLKQAYARQYDEMQAGRDLYFTHAGHGVGYWDRAELDSDGLGGKLSNAAGRGEINLFAYQDERVPAGFRVEFDIS